MLMLKNAEGFQLNFNFFALLGTHETERNYNVGWDQRVSRKAFVIHCDHQRRIFTITCGETSGAIALDMKDPSDSSDGNVFLSINSNHKRQLCSR